MAAVEEVVVGERKGGGSVEREHGEGVKVDQEITKLLSLICYLNIIDFFRLDIIFRERKRARRVGSGLWVLSGWAEW